MRTWLAVVTDLVGQPALDQGVHVFVGLQSGLAGFEPGLDRVQSVENPIAGLVVNQPGGRQFTRPRTVHGQLVGP